MNALERAHDAMLRLDAFVTSAQQLERDGRWRDRVSVLLNSAIDPLGDALIYLERALDAFDFPDKGVAQTTIAT